MSDFGSDDTLAQAIASWLPQARWFPAKTEATPAVALVDRIPLPTAATCEVVVAETRSSEPAEGPRRFLLPVCWGKAGPVDAATDPAVASWIVTAAQSGQRAAGRTSSLVGTPVPVPAVPPARDQPPPARIASVSPLAADSSNTLVAVRHSDATGSILKLLRQIRPGIQPEVEIGRFLATDPLWRHTPRLRAAREWHSPGSEPAVVAVIHDEVRGAESLWDLLLRVLTASGSEHLRDALMPTLMALGRVTAQMHQALAGERGDPAFGSEPWSAADRRAAATAMTDHAEQVFHSLAATQQSLPAAAAAMLANVLSHRDAWLARLAMPAGSAWRSRRIRVHGDYHLGQVLFAEETAGASLQDRLLIIDFEGEPQRPLAERRLKRSAAKDVAGMLRSLDYLVRVAERERGEPLPADTHDRLSGWFLGSYTATAEASCFWPSDPTEARTLLELHCLEKAIYELAYEANNRPDWIDVPLAALLAMLDS